MKNLKIHLIKYGLKMNEDIKILNRLLDNFNIIFIINSTTITIGKPKSAIS